MNKPAYPDNSQGTGNFKKRRSTRVALPSGSTWSQVWLWIAIGITAIATIVLGYIGFWKNADSLSEVRTPLDILYLTLQLFVMESGNVSGHVPWELEVSRLIAPFIPAWTIIAAAAFLFRDRIKQLRVRWLRDHIVICGLSRLGLELARDAYLNGYRVVVVDAEEENDFFTIASEVGCNVIVGNIADAATLSRARAHHARHFFAAADEDGMNVAAAVALQDIVLKQPELSSGHLSSYIHVTDPGLCFVLQEHRLASHPARSPDMNFFNYYQDSVRLLMEEHPLDREFISSYEPRSVQLIIVGLGRMGQSLALEAARTGHFANGRPLLISVVDLEAEGKLQAFYGRHPKFCQVCNVRHKDGNIDDVGMLQQIEAWAGDRKLLTTVAICLDGDSRAFSAALAISSHIAAPVPIWVRLSGETGFVSLTAGHMDAETWNTNIFAFGRMSEIHTLDKLFQRQWDKTARMIHENYVRARSKEGRSANDPSTRPWKDLDETLKNSNRHQADHIAVKLRAIHCHIADMDSESKSVTLTDSEVEIMARMEHARWNAERILSGWTQGSKDLAKKTSPYLVPWADLPENIRELDREVVRQIPHLLSLTGCLIKRAPK